METREHYLERLKRARKRVNAIKGFYKHLTVYITINLIILFLKAYFLGFFESNGITDENVIYWLEWNIISTPILWGIGLAIHGLYVLKFNFMRNWEERQIKKYMEEDSRKV